MLFLVPDVEDFMCDVHDIAADPGHRNRHISCCQSAVSKCLCELSISKGECHLAPTACCHSRGHMRIYACM